MTKFPIRKILLPTTTALILAAAAPVSAAESIFDRFKGGLQNVVDQAYGGGQAVTVSEHSFVVNALIILNYLLTFLGIVFFGLLLYSGFLWMNARGNEDQLMKAKKITREVIIGFLIILTARVVTEFILNAVLQSVQTPAVN
jgi:hypothetical protein